MASGMKLHDVVQKLRQHGCIVKSDDGSHTKWACPCGQHTANVPRHREISPGVIRDTIKRMACLPEGWLQ